MIKTIEVAYNHKVRDPLGDGIKKSIHEMGTTVHHVRFVQLYQIKGNLSPSHLKLFCEDLLTDRVNQNYSDHHVPVPRGSSAVEVWFKPGVTDVVGESVLKAARDMGIFTLSEVRTGSKYILEGISSLITTKIIAHELLSNSLIHSVKIIKGDH